MINGQTQLVGLIGWPVEHSLSPIMHNAAFDALRLNWRYVPLPVPPGQVEAAVRGLGALGFRGANVTVPHKQAVMSALDSIAPGAAYLGAVNTLVIGRGAGGPPVIGGYNTDDIGFVASLRHSGYEPEEGRRAVVVGAGGAARAVISGLLWSSLMEVMVLNRDAAHSQALRADLGRHEKWSPRLRALPLTVETLIESARDADLLVNATTVGMWPHDDDSIWPDSVAIPSHLAVFDVVYNPLETRLLRQARESGAHPIGGLEMLVRQGAIAFEMWTGEGPADQIANLMRVACEQAPKT